MNDFNERLENMMIKFADEHQDWRAASILEDGIGFQSNVYKLEKWTVKMWRQLDMNKCNTGRNDCSSIRNTGWLARESSAERSLEDLCGSEIRFQSTVLYSCANNKHHLSCPDWSTADKVCKYFIHASFTSAGTIWLFGTLHLMKDLDQLVLNAGSQKDHRSKKPWLWGKTREIGIVQGCQSWWGWGREKTNCHVVITIFFLISVFCQ